MQRRPEAAVPPAGVSIIISVVFFTARLSAAARARRDDYLPVNLKVFTPMFWMQVRLVGWPGRPPPGLTTDFSVPMPLPGAHQTAGRSLVATNGDAKRPPVTMVSTPTHGVLQTLIGLFPCRAV